MVWLRARINSLALGRESGYLGRESERYLHRDILAENQGDMIGCGEERAELGSATLKCSGRYRYML